MMLEALSDENYWQYRGKCRNCGFVCEWCVQRRENYTWFKFKEYVTTQYFPCFFSMCEHCRELAVFDLMAISPREEY